MTEHGGSADLRFLVWSNEHGAWWRAGGHGYTLDYRSAGRYRADEADEICVNAGAYGPHGKGVPAEVKVLAPECRWQGGPPVPFASVQVEKIDLSGWSGDMADNQYAELFDAALDSGELLLYDRATGEAHPVTRAAGK